VQRDRPQAASGYLCGGDPVLGKLAGAAIDGWAGGESMATCGLAPAGTDRRQRRDATALSCQLHLRLSAGGGQPYCGNRILRPDVRGTDGDLAVWRDSGLEPLGRGEFHLAGNPLAAAFALAQ